MSFVTRLFTDADRVFRLQDQTIAAMNTEPTMPRSRYVVDLVVNEEDTTTVAVPLQGPITVDGAAFISVRYATFGDTPIETRSTYELGAMNEAGTAGFKHKRLYIGKTFADFKITDGQMFVTSGQGSLSVAYDPESGLVFTCAAPEGSQLSCTVSISRLHGVP